MTGPRRELTQDADALGRVALIAEYFADLAERAGDENHAEEVEVDADCLHRWEGLLRSAREEVHPNRQMKDGG